MDIIIPVYNAKEATKRCIESIYEHIAHMIGHVYIHNDKSASDTTDMLNLLDFPNLHIHHSLINLGFGAGVNYGISQASSEYVLVLNSDTLAEDDFISALIVSMDKYKVLAALNVNGDVFSGKKLHQYDQHRGFIQSYSLSGFAFLVRRSVFIALGGFDSIYGRGYFEDTDLARRIIKNGGEIGMHPGTYLKHEHQGAFKNITGTNQLIRLNQSKYFGRYPDADKNILLFSGNIPWSDLKSELLEHLEEGLKNGVKVYWVSKNSDIKLPYLDVKFFNKGLRRINRLMGFRKKDKHKGIDVVYFTFDVNPFVVKLYSWLAKRKRIRVKIY
ncbi:MAG: glycosyltransferase [gamma proteobacterium symbiont of Taylorina sp.]|nr:glycosyltransferase [gamma proteobacterium symbiont of Taylorina sp.]